MMRLYRGAFVAGLVPAEMTAVPLHASASRALESQCVAVDGQRMQQHLGVSAVGLGALQVRGGVADQSPVAVRGARGALTAGFFHEPLLASPRGATPMPRRDP